MGIVNGHFTSAFITAPLLSTPPCSAQYSQWIESELKCRVQTRVNHLKEIAATITDTSVYALWTVLFQPVQYHMCVVALGAV